MVSTCQCSEMRCLVLEPPGISEIPGSPLGLSGGDGDLVTASRAEVQASYSDLAFVP